MAVDVETYSVEGNDYPSCYKLAKTLEDRYILYKQKYVKICDPERTAKYKSPTTTEVAHIEDYMLLDHLHGDYAVGVFAGPKATKFICVDVDLADADVVHTVVNTLTGMWIPRDRIYVSLSGGKGYHVDILVRPMIWNEKAKLIYDEMIEISGLDKRKVEFRATNKQAVKLPLGIHQRTKCRCWYVDRETLEPICDLNYIYETIPVDSELIESIADRYSRKKLAEIYIDMRKHRETKARRASGSPPGFDVTAPSTRHVMQCKYAIWLRRHGASRQELFNEQMAWYDRQNRSLISSMPDEVARDANEIADWCMKNVAVADGIPDRNKAPVVEITQDDIAMVLGAPTPVYRRVAFYLLVYCKRYESIKIAHQTIADRVGVSRRSVLSAVEWMCDHGLLKKERVFDKVNGCFVNTSSRYSIGEVVCGKQIPKRYQRRECVVVDEWMSDAQLFNRVYSTVLSKMCRPIYLERIMSPDEYQKYLEGDNATTDKATDAGRDS